MSKRSREYMDCKHCNADTGHTRTAGCLIAAERAAAVNEASAVGVMLGYGQPNRKLTEYGYRFQDGSVLPMGVQYSDAELARNGDPELLSEIQGQPVEWVKRTISEWEDVQVLLVRPEHTDPDSEWKRP